MIVFCRMGVKGNSEFDVRHCPKTTPQGFLVFKRIYAIAAASWLSLALVSGVAQGLQGQPVQAPAQARSNLQSLLATADSVLDEMSRMTGLPIKAPLKKQIIGRTEVQKYLVENLHAEYTPEDLRVQKAVLQAFGLASRDFDLEKLLITFYTEQAAGFYDPRHKTMFIADWVGEDMQGLVLAHELTHALQDQNFDLEQFLHAARENDDATGARQAVVEGYATAAMMQRLLGSAELASLPSFSPMLDQIVRQQMEEFPAFSSAPFFFRLQALFPYAQGLRFIQQGLVHGGWKKLNTLFDRPPLTTKEIFDPQVYFESKPLPGLSLPRPAALAGVAGTHVLAENVMGELGYYALLGQLISEEEAKAVATGWLADRFILYENTAKDHYGLVARTRWSSPETALAFFRDYHTILEHKYPGIAPDTRSTTGLFIGSTASGTAILLHKGDEVLWAEGIPTPQTDAMLDWLKSLAPDKLTAQSRAVVGRHSAWRQFDADRESTRPRIFKGGLEPWIGLHQLDKILQH